MRPPQIRGRDFLLRAFRASDAESLQRAINDRSVYRYTWLIPHPYTLAHARKFIAGANRGKTEVSFAIIAGGDVIGGIGITHIEGHKARIGYWLRKDMRGKGIMTRAVKLVANYAFSRLRIRRISAHVFIPNIPSQRVLMRAGFRKEGLLRKYVRKDGTLRDVILLAKVSR